MTDWPFIAVRLALYGTLGLLFGLPLFSGWLTARTREPAMPRLAPTVTALLAGAGILLSLLGFALQIAAMGGTGLTGIDPAVADFILRETASGWALLARLGALSFALAIALVTPAGAAKTWLLTLAGGVAVASLAWGGHGAATPDAPGTVHLAADIVHLLAASAWLGALAVLLILVTPRGPATPARVASAHTALAGFATLGTAIVALIIASGLVNSVFLVRLDRMTSLGDSPYGRLLLLKLALFLAMLGCAAANRFRLTPRLASAMAGGDTAPALARLRRSVALETALALLILGLVAWLGTLEPPVSGA